MTLVEITYELKFPLTEDQLRHLGQFANTYGLRSFRVDDAKKQLSFEYDASRLRAGPGAHRGGAPSELIGFWWARSNVAIQTLEADDVALEAGSL